MKGTVMRRECDLRTEGRLVGREIRFPLAVFCKFSFPFLIIEPLIPNYYY